MIFGYHSKKKLARALFFVRYYNYAQKNYTHTHTHTSSTIESVESKKIFNMRSYWCITLHFKYNTQDPTMKWTLKNAFKKIQAKKTYTGLSLSFYFFDEKKPFWKVMEVSYVVEIVVANIIIVLLCVFTYIEHFHEQLAKIEWKK